MAQNQFTLHHKEKNMADLYNTDLSQNAISVTPTSNLGTRKIVWLSLSADDNFWQNGDYADSDSNYSQVVRKIQECVELFYLGSPSSDVTDAFVFAVAVDTTDAIYAEGDYTDDVETSEDYEPNYLGWVLDQYYDGNFNLYVLNARGAIID